MGLKYGYNSICNKRDLYRLCATFLLNYRRNINNYKSEKMAVFWVIEQCSLVKFINVSDVLAASTITHRPDDGGSKDL
jgi:hypothetical protein